MYILTSDISQKTECIKTIIDNNDEETKKARKNTKQKKKKQTKKITQKLKKNALRNFIIVYQNIARLE